MILYDSFNNTLLPLLRLKPLFNLRTGMLTESQRLKLQGKEISQIQSQRTGFLPLSELEVNIAAVSAGSPMTPTDLLNNLSDNLIQDFALLKSTKKTGHIPSSVIGDSKDIYVDEGTEISPSCEFDVRNGPIFIGKSCRLGAFSVITGPAYIGSHSILDRCSFELSSAGVHSRLGGEISNSIIGDYSNKHHEGFLGHSLVGDWVNLGALTTTSDLKNNYGEIKLSFEQEQYPTGRIKLGSIIGDFSKTAIGTMLNTGTIIDFGSCLFADRPQLQYYYPFFWGGHTPGKYDLERFLADATKIMARRDQILPSELETLIRQFYQG